MNNDLNQNLNNNVTPQPIPNTDPQQPQPIPSPEVPPVQPTPMASQPDPMMVNNGVQQPAAQPMADQVPQEPQMMNNPQEPQMVNQTPQEKPPKQKSNPVLIFLMFVALIGGAIYFGYNYFVANKPTKTTTTTTTTTDDTNEVMQNDEAVKLVKEVIKKYVQPYGVICGEMDYEDTIDESDKHYSASKTYTKITEIDTYLATFLSSDFIKDNIDKTKYLEKDSKLYCNTPQRGTLIYNEEGSTYTVSELTSEKITATGTISYTVEGGATESYPLEVSLIKENGSWLLNKYQETR